MTKALNFFIKEQVNAFEKIILKDLWMMMANGRWCTSDEHKERVAKTYLQRLFTTTTNPNQMDHVLNKVKRVVAPDMNHALFQPYSLDEVKRALFQMHPSKSPVRMVCLPSTFKNIGI